MSIIELGALGEFLGSIAVLATLVYLSVQIRQNTRSMDESKKLALAQTYQMRADALQMMLVHAADSEHVGPIITKLTGAGYPEDIGALDVLSKEERGRFRQWQIAQQTHWDNMFFQYQQGFIDEEYYRDSFRERVRRLAPAWRALNVAGARESFNEEIRDILAEGQNRT
ncbi:MAG: hypothetical protein ACE5FV_08815 [Woeseia sp.]